MATTRTGCGEGGPELAPLALLAWLVWLAAAAALSLLALLLVVGDLRVRLEGGAQAAAVADCAARRQWTDPGNDIGCGGPGGPANRQILECWLAGCGLLEILCRLGIQVVVSSHPSPRGLSASGALLKAEPLRGLSLQGLQPVRRLCLPDCSPSSCTTAARPVDLSSC